MAGVTFRLTRETLDRSPWFPAQEYPYASRFSDLPHGRMHYVDEGRGPAILLVHGTPSWSFEYRGVIARLRNRYRCIAADHFGFGLSDRPAHGPTLDEHAAALAGFVAALHLDDLHLVVHDFGGPIALPLLLTNRPRVRSVTILNSWFWPFEDADPRFARQKTWVDTWPMRMLYLHANFSARAMVRMSWGTRRPLDRARHAQFLEMFPTAASRQATWALAQATVSSRPYYEARAQVLTELRTRQVAIVWGLTDRLVGAPHLAYWRQRLQEARITVLPDAGHFLQDEAPDEVAAAIAAISE